MKTDNNKNMFIAVLVLWGGLVVISLIMTVIGFLIYMGRMEGSRFTLPLGLLILVRSVTKIIGSVRYLRRSAEEPAGNSDTADGSPETGTTPADKTDNAAAAADKLLKETDENEPV